MVFDITVICIRITDCQFGCDDVANQGPLQIKWMNFVTFGLINWDSDKNGYYLLRTAAKDCCVCIYVSLTNPSIRPIRVVKAFAIRRSLATVSMTIADFHHSPTITLIMLRSACLDGNC